jgi:two-component sensor histidine kinase
MNEKKLNRELEVKVKERTKDLAEINKDLEREITERRLAEERITESLREKETLLRELYHRTRNNMQVISNLIDLQALSINDKKIVELFKETQSRIKSMALVHEKLYQSKDLSNVNLKDYINELANTLLTSYQISRDTIVLKLDIDNISVSIDAAIPSGLIVNELMSNSLKYAFPGGRQGEISIILHKNEKGEIELYFSDKGIGFPKGFDINNPKSLGLKLVKNLTEKQLEGKVELRTNQRTEFLIKFKEPQYLKSI